LPSDPQQYAAPVVVSPHACSQDPALTDANCSDPATSNGVLLQRLIALSMHVLVNVSMPNSPISFAPQQYAACAGVTPHAKASPTLILENDRPPTTGVGESRKASVAYADVPSPNSPSPFGPQQ
jgi:hypothetical protein